MGINIGSTGRDVKHHRARFSRKFDEPIALPNERDAPHDVSQRRQCVLSCVGS